MKELLAVLILLCFNISSLNAQIKKDGTPDMRYKANKEAYGSYSAPSVKGITNSDVQYQQTYIKSNGKIVKSHYKTKNNETNKDNFSTKDNVNTYTRESGSKAKDYSPEAKNYGKGKIIYEGPKGGQYYINDKGKKVYVPKR
jgi:hypothetical protein